MKVTVTLHCDGVAGKPGHAGQECTNELSVQWTGDADELDTLPLAFIDMAKDVGASGWESRPVGTTDGEKSLILCPTCGDTLATWAASQLTSGES